MLAQRWWWSKQNLQGEGEGVFTCGGQKWRPWKCLFKKLKLKQVTFDSMYLTLWCLFVNQRGWRDEATEQQDYIGILMSRQSCSLLLGCWEQNCIRLAASHTTEHHGGREIERKLNKVKHYWAEISDILTIDHLTIDHLTIHCLTTNGLTINCRNIDHQTIGCLTIHFLTTNGLL